MVKYVQARTLMIGVGLLILGLSSWQIFTAVQGAALTAYSASSTWRQAAGSADILIGGRPPDRASDGLS